MPIQGLTIDTDADAPVYRQIAEGIRAAVRDGRLLEGRRLPATRDLARDLGVNRNTVVAAYDDLAADGWVRSHTGRGTFVARPAADTPADTAAIGDDFWPTAFSRAVERTEVGGLLSMYRHASGTGGISFAGSYPARELLPVEAFRSATARALDTLGADALVYGPTAGLPALRDWIAEHMTDRGSRVDGSRVVITSGAQQAIELVFSTFLDRGDAVVIEEPTYTGALSVLASIGARAIGVPLDAEGLRPDLLADALERHRPRLIYVQPGLHNPTTASMGVQRRRDLLALAARYRCLIVEDDWASGLRFDGEEPPTLHALDGGRRTIYLNTLSKKLLPGVRIGWVSAPPPVIDRLVALKQIRDCGTSPVTQAAVLEFLRAGGLDEHLPRVRRAYRERRDVMLAALERRMPAGATWTTPAGGLFVWVTLPPRVDGQELYVAARQRGILYSGGDVFHGGPGGRNAMRLTFSVADPPRIDDGVRALGELIRERWPESAEPRPRPAAEAVPIL